MAELKESPAWQRAIAAALALGGGGVFLYDLFVRGFSSWLDGMVAVGTLYGVYLFGFFAVTGSLPAVIRGGRSGSLSSRGNGDA